MANFPKFNATITAKDEYYEFFFSRFTQFCDKNQSKLCFSIRGPREGNYLRISKLDKDIIMSVRIDPKKGTPDIAVGMNDDFDNAILSKLAKDAKRLKLEDISGRDFALIPSTGDRKRSRAIFRGCDDESISGSECEPIFNTLADRLNKTFRTFSQL